MSAYLNSFRKYSVMLPYLISTLSVLAYLGQNLISLELIPVQYQFIVTAILVPLSAQLGRLIPQPNLPDSVHRKQ